MVFTAAITARAVMQSVVDEVFKKDQRSDENDNASKCLRVVRCLRGEQGTHDRIERMEERERGAAYPRVTTCCRDKRNCDQNTAVPRENEWVE
jgi:hypothetical protein